MLKLDNFRNYSYLGGGSVLQLMVEGGLQILGGRIKSIVKRDWSQLVGWRITAIRGTDYIYWEARLITASGGGLQILGGRITSIGRRDWSQLVEGADYSYSSETDYRYLEGCRITANGWERITATEGGRITANWEVDGIQLYWVGTDSDTCKMTITYLLYFEFLKFICID